MSTHQVVPIRPNNRIEFAMIREANHRVANHLSLLAGLVQAQATSVSKGPLQFERDHVRGMLQDVAGKVISVGHLHRKLSDEGHDGEIDLGDYLIECSQALIKSLSLEGRIGVVHRLGSRCAVSPEQAQPMALIVSEIMMNAIKYAHPTGLPVEIAIRCDNDSKGQVVVSVDDDGVGLPEGFDPKTGGGVGFRLIRLLSSSLGAELHVDSDSLGTRFRVTLPATAANDPA
jgi:two-component sensor histidine kinase